MSGKVHKRMVKEYPDPSVNRRIVARAISEGTVMLITSKISDNQIIGTITYRFPITTGTYAGANNLDDMWEMLTNNGFSQISEELDKQYSIRDEV